MEQKEMLTEVPDAELISRILKGEKSLFEILIRKYNQRLYRVGMSILSDDMETEDAMQTAYIKAYEHLKDFEQRSSFITWLTRIMLNQCYEQKRKAELNKNGVRELFNEMHMKTPANILANKELGAALEHAITLLPEKYRIVFVLREIENMSVRETSEALHIEEPNVKVRLNRAKTMLRDNLQDYMKDSVYSFHLVKCDRIVNYVMSRI